MKKPRYRVVVPAGSTLRGLFQTREAARKRCDGATERNPAHRFYHMADDVLAAAVQQPARYPQGTTPPYKASQAEREAFARDWRMAHEQRDKELSRRWAAANKAAYAKDWRSVEAICRAGGILGPWEDDRFSKNTEQGRSRK